MRNIELYISGQRVDLFNDESVTIKDSIQDVRDIEKIFTSFSKSFNIPASKTNNKLFKHYYNFDIDDGFDARIRVNSTIEINSLPFKIGKVKLEGVSLKYNKPHTYKITFFGDTVELKDLLGEDKLNSLPLNQYNEIYSAPRVKALLKRNADFQTNSIICPLITHTQRLYYDSGSHAGAGDGNLFWDQGHTQDLHGVKWNELKYAIRVNKLIEAIEDRYTIANGYPVNLIFDTTFFKNTDYRRVNNLFMWLHRKSGKVENLTGNSTTEHLVNDWIPSSSNFEGFQIDSVYLETGYLDNPTQDIDRFRLVCLPVDTTINYSVRVERNGNTVFQSAEVSGYQNFDLDDYYQNSSYYQVFIISDTQVSFTRLEWNIAYYYENQWGEFDFESFAYYTTAFTTSTEFEFVISQQIPDMKVIDFLTGLFKMFNLTAYVNEELSDRQNTYIKIQTLDEYYATYNTWDISDYVDVKKQEVNIALPYKKVYLLYKDSKTFLANRFKQLANKAWGELSYSAGENNLDGSLYKIELPFGHMQYERLRDEDTGGLKNIQYGYSVNESQNSYKGMPVLFYPVLQNAGGISFANSVQDGIIQEHEYLAGNICMPSNSVTFSPTGTGVQNINFENEINEWTGTTEFTSTLFEDFYKSYLLGVFNSKQRITKVDVYLPISILLNYKLSDRFTIGENRYKINSITTNLQTGKSQLELLNDL